MARAGARVGTTLGALAGLLGAPAAGAQPPPGRPSAARAALELRADGAADRAPGAFVGGGAFADAGAAVRLGLTAGVGAAYGRGGTAGPRRWGAAAEVAAVGRFLFDPFRQGARGVYAGGGVGLRAADGDGRPFVVLAAGVEGRARRGVAPAVEVGLGHGVRAAVVLRRARPGRR